MLDLDKLRKVEVVYSISPYELKPHPFNIKIYTDHPDPVFDRDIRENGIRNPLIVNKSLEVLDGNRRLKRAKP